MSQNYGEPTSGSQAGSGSGTAETAKHEAGEVAGTAKAEAGHVVETAKQEAAGVASEAKSQAKQVYTQTKQQLTEQAASQQQRVADGLRSIGDELDSLAQNSENPGIATDLVRQVSSRVSGASDWLSQRDPGSLVSEVKSFARRKPGVFIAGALIAGVVAGRLTRALAEGAKEEHDSGTGTTSGGVPAAPSAPSPAPVNAPLDAPIGTPGAAATGIPAAPSAPSHAPVGAPLDDPIGSAPDAAEPTPLYDSSVGRTADEPYTEGIGETRDDR
ncbi:hypothetical protein MTS1_02258 [Microbacterium sp. TS-1]|jgi:uncharacterized protein YjbJ (UPF0337 family)|uniref:CsbD family protein n=1 Tax=Microbacterium sp. TS-1 TaxID=1344956 RepID=UPI00038FA9DC|nr:CsbD family protein [Microbacterium sp. TS-1]GAD34887.1 hypothetical protein MTS1_02258 [Microbacterium sp. TS-1]